MNAATPSLALLASLCVGCSGILADPEPASSVPPTFTPPLDPGPPEAVAVEPTRLHRLGRFQFEQTLRDLLGPTNVFAVTLPVDVILDGFESPAASPVSAPLVEAQLAIAESAVSRAATSREGSLGACPAGTPAEPCAHLHR